MRTDEERLNFLQKLTDEGRYTGKVILRQSSTGRGWKLHETSFSSAKPSVREAIDDFMDSSVVRKSRQHPNKNTNNSKSNRHAYP